MHFIIINWWCVIQMNFLGIYCCSEWWHQNQLQLDNNIYLHSQFVLKMLIWSKIWVVSWFYNNSDFKYSTFFICLSQINVNRILFWRAHVRAKLISYEPVKMHSITNFYQKFHPVIAAQMMVIDSIFISSSFYNLSWPATSVRAYVISKF